MSDYFWPLWGCLVGLCLIALATKALGFVPWPKPFHIDGRA